MNLPVFSVRRPVFVSMITLIIIILGLVSFQRLQIDLLPSIEMPTITIRTEFEGANPLVVEQLISQIIEEIIATVPGVEEIYSQSTEGRSEVRVRFSWGKDIDMAAIDLSSQLENEIGELPDDIVRPEVSKFDVASFPVVIMGISSPMDPLELTRIVEEQLRYRFTRIPGVAQVDTWGIFQREIRIELDPEKIKALGIPLNAVLTAVRDANVDLPTGKIDDGQFEVALRAPAEFLNVEQIRNTAVFKRNDQVITLRQIADVRDTYEKSSRIVRLNGDMGLRIAIRKQPQANTVDVATAVLAEIERVNEEYPQVLVIPVVNQGNFIERSIRNVAQSVMYGGGLSVIVLLFFLRNLRSTLVISLAIPISIVATFAIMYFGGLTINLMTLGGLALGVGMMVDSSVVVLENIYRRRQENGEDAQVAATRGAEEVGGAVLASTLTTLVIFLPLVFVKGVSGLLFREFAYTVMFSLFCAMMVALSLVPMLASKLLKSPDEQRASRPQKLERLALKAEAGFAALDAFYARLLKGALKHRILVLGVSVGLLACSLGLLPMIGREFLPPSDEGEVRVTGEMDVGTRLDLVDRLTRQMAAIVLPAVPEVVSSVTSASIGGRSPLASGEITMSLTPASQRSRSNTDIADDLRKRLEGQIPGMKIRVRAPQGQFLLERILGGAQSLTVDVQGYDLEGLNRLSSQVAAAIENIEGITDLDISRKTGIPQIDVVVDRDKVADLGFSPRDVSQALETAVAGSQAGQFRSRGQSYRIFVQLKNAEKQSLDDVLDLVLANPAGEPVALRNLVTTASSQGPFLIERKNQQRIVTVSANVDGRDMGSVTKEVRSVLKTIVVPEGYTLNLAGTVEEQEKSSREFSLSLLLALVFVYMVMACQYESLRDPLIVMVSVPLAAIGVLTTLFLTHTTLNLQSYIGCIMLGGIVVNNAILLVDQAGQLCKQGFPVYEAVVESGRRRLRPILMTTLTTVLALLPLAFGVGEGADAQAPMARAVVGGLTTSTLITLVLIPIVYTLLHGGRKAPA